MIARSDTWLSIEGGAPVQDPPNQPKHPPVEEPGETPPDPPPFRTPPMRDPDRIPRRPPVKEPPEGDNDHKVGNRRAGAVSGAGTRRYPERSLS